jgi:hypothetical protein
MKAVGSLSPIRRRRAALRVFELLRDEDVSGVSGVGRVAVGAVFPSGRVVLEWLGANSSFEIFEQLEHVDRIHGHGGKTRLVFKNSK